MPVCVRERELTKDIWKDNKELELLQEQPFQSQTLFLSWIFTEKWKMVENEGK